MSIGVTLSGLFWQRLGYHFSLIFSLNVPKHRRQAETKAHYKKKRQTHKYKYFRHCLKYPKCVENPRQAFFFCGHVKHYLTQNSKNFRHYLG